MAGCNPWLVYVLIWLLLAAVPEAFRELHTETGSAQAFCPDGCAFDGCVQDATAGGLRCQRCEGNLVVNKANGNCACPAGQYASSPDTCSDCNKGSWCAGGDYFLPSNPLNPWRVAGDVSATPFAPHFTLCPLGTSGVRMTTIGRRAQSMRACVNVAGQYYTVTSGWDFTTIDQVLCPENTYSPGLKKQRACVPCPTGYTTNGIVGATTPMQCVVPPGYFLKAPGQVAPCPQGEWKSGPGMSANCTKCAFGVSTPGEASTRESDCRVIEAGYYASVMINGSVRATAPCPQSYWCPGGQALQAFTPDNPNPDASPPTGTIFRCPYGMLTVEVGSISPEQCLTPPGHYTTANGTWRCPLGHYRQEWLPFGQAKACRSCGVGVKALRSDRVTLFDTSTYEPYQVEVTTTGDDCYIMPGQGLYFMSLEKSFRARNCTVNMYGVPNITFGLSPSPCRNCPLRMVTALTSPNASFPTSASYFVRDGDSEGFIDVAACVTIDGYGYDSRNSQPCPKGFYNPRDSYTDCTPCPGYGLTTEGVGLGVNVSSCGIAAGFGYSEVEQGVVPCPIGTFNNVSWTPGNTTAVCRPCGEGSTTTREGASESTQCSICLVSWGGPSCATLCGGEGDDATYGGTGRSTDRDPSCTPCTTQNTGFSFDWGGWNDLYQSVAISRKGANASTDCVSKWSQLVDGAWYIPMPEGDPYSTVFSDVNTFRACVQLCDYDPCQFVTYDYAERTCTVRNATAPSIMGAPLIGFKNLPSGDVGTNIWSSGSNGATANSENAVQPGSSSNSSSTAHASQPDSSQQAPDAQAKFVSVATGMYTFYREELALTVGTQEDPSKYGITVPAGTGQRFLQNCLNACDEVVRCAGVTIRMNVVLEDRPTTCKLIVGSTQLGMFKRTVTRADPERMPLPSLDDTDNPVG